MPDREKVKKGLYQHCEGSMFDRCGECPYYEVADEPFQCRDELLHDALTLLKEQEDDEPKQVGVYGKEDWYGLVYTCPYCNAAWMGDRTDTHFCPECGKAVKSGG